MTSTDTPAALTARDVPAPLGVCDTCGATPALPELGSRDYRCPPCHVRNLLTDAAAAHLRKLLTPFLGAWADHWTAAGLGPEQLGSVLQVEAETIQERRAVIVRDLLEHHRPPAYQDAEPERVTVRLEELPTLADRLRADPARGITWPFFTTRNADGSGGTYSEAPGLDLLTLELPDGSAVLLPLGHRGSLDLPDALGSAVRIPAHLREQARAVYFPRSGGQP